MLNVLLARLQQRHRTMEYPDGPAPALPDRFAGKPTISPGRCPNGCRSCIEACPTQALSMRDTVRIDLGRCLFCRECATACPEQAIRFTNEHRMATSGREDLVLEMESSQSPRAIEAKAKRLFGRSLKLRQVSAGGCNACESDTNVLGTVGWDLGRFGIQFVASPRHADGLLVTGPVPENMRLALLKTYEAVPAPKLVIVAGACAISGGPYIDHAMVHNGAEGLVPVDLYIPRLSSSPPHHPGRSATIHRKNPIAGESSRNGRESGFSGRAISWANLASGKTENPGGPSDKNRHRCMRSPSFPAPPRFARSGDRCAARGLFTSRKQSWHGSSEPLPEMSNFFTR